MALRLGFNPVVQLRNHHMHFDIWNGFWHVGVIQDTDG